MTGRRNDLRAHALGSGQAPSTSAPAPKDEATADRRAEAKRRFDAAQRRALASAKNQHVLAELAKR
jgi:hypothetical protein